MEQSRTIGGKVVSTKRRFFRIHLISMMLIMLTASLLVYGNVVLGQFGDSLDPEIDIEIQVVDGARRIGWPIVACYTVTDKDGTWLGKFNGWQTGWDLAVALSLLTLVIIPVEWAERRRPWLRGHVSVGMALLGCVVVLLLNEGQNWVCFGILATPVFAALLVAVVLVLRWTERRL